MLRTEVTLVLVRTPLPPVHPPGEALAGNARNTVQKASSMAAEGTAPATDTNASAEYREHMARVLVRRGIEEALDR